MTLQQLSKLESVVSEGVKLRNRSARINHIKSMFLEMDNPLSGGVEKIARLRIGANGAALEFIDTSNQSRNTLLEISVEDGRKLAGLFREFCDQGLRIVAQKMENITCD